jgi:hypothetical protein
MMSHPSKCRILSLTLRIWLKEAMDTASVVVFGQRPDSLARKRRARPVVPEQASLFSLS